MKGVALAAVTAILTGPAFAQEAPTCFARVEVASSLAAMGYVMSFVGVTGKGEGMLVFTNPVSGEWILIGDEGPHRSCVIIGGPAFSVILPGVPS